VKYEARRKRRDLEGERTAEKIKETEKQKQKSSCNKTRLSQKKMKKKKGSCERVNIGQPQKSKFPERDL